jgi:hypothetical protein
VASCSEGCFSIDDIDTLQISRLFFGDPDAPAGIEMHALLRRHSNFYRGEGMFPGALETWWDDYSHWTIEVLATADSDSNGVPDLSDFVPGAPYIAHQPANITTIAGANAFLHVDARGAEPLYYQWYSNSFTLNDATNALLPFSPVTTNAAASYAVRVSNSAGAVSSTYAAVKVLQPLVGEVELEWALSANLPGNKLAIDSEGNVVAGGIGKISPSGEVLYAFSAPAQDFVLDSADNVYVTGSFSSNGDSAIQTGKYDASGNSLWTRVYAGSPDKRDQAVAIGIDSTENVYVAGWTGVAGVPEQYLLMKYDAAGQQQWVRTYQPQCLDHGLLSMTIENSGAAYIAGLAAVVKYDTDGNQVWAIACTNFLPLKLKLDAAGNLLIGISYEGGYGVSKRSPSGDLLWELRYTNGIGLSDIAIDSKNSIYLANLAGQVLKIDAGGGVLWTGASAGILALGEAGEVYSTGTIRDNTSTRNTDIFTRKINAQGSNAWSARYPDPFVDTDVPYSIAVDSDGAVYVGGVLGRIFPVIIKYIQSAPGASIRPTHQRAVTGSSVVFNAFYRGPAPASYQWRFQNNNLTGATSATLILENIHESDSGDYTVMIIDSDGNQSSATGRLTVLEPRPIRFESDPYFRLVLNADPGPYWLETSTDLLHWTKYLALQLLSATPIQMPTDRYPQLFFRAVQRQ